MTRSERKIHIPISKAWEGINSCLDQSKELYQGAFILFNNNHYISSSILSNYVIEEVVKGLILLNAYHFSEGEKLHIEKDVFKKHHNKRRITFGQDCYNGQGNIAVAGKLMWSEVGGLVKITLGGTLDRDIGIENVKRHKELTHVDFSDTEWKVPQIEKAECERFLKIAYVLLMEFGGCIDREIRLEKGEFERLPEGVITIHGDGVTLRDPWNYNIRNE